MSDPSRMPAIFFGHGNPMNALHDNVYGRGWAALAARVPRPRAILCVSAHWYVPYTAGTAIDKPRTIHAVGGPANGGSGSLGSWTSVVTGRPEAALTRSRIRRPSSSPTPRNESRLERLALSNDALKTAGRP